MSSSDEEEFTHQVPQHAGDDEPVSTPWSDKVQWWYCVNRGEEEDEDHPSLSFISVFNLFLG